MFKLTLIIALIMGINFEAFANTDARYLIKCPHPLAIRKMKCFGTSNTICQTAALVTAVKTSGDGEEAIVLVLRGMQLFNLKASSKITAAEMTDYHGQACGYINTDDNNLTAWLNEFDIERFAITQCGFNAPDTIMCAVKNNG